MHYDIKAAVIHYGRSDERKWRDLPHVFFANLSLNTDTVRMFEDAFGPICGSGYSVAPQKRFRIIKGAGGGISLKAEKSNAIVHGSALAEAKIRQHMLRRAWEGDEAHLKMLWSGARSLVEYDPVLMVAAFDREAIHLSTQDMWSFIRLAFQIDCLRGLTGVCENPECPAPYFIAKRKNRKKYCSLKCTNLMNVRRFREREKRKHSQKQPLARAS